MTAPSNSKSATRIDASPSVDPGATETLEGPQIAADEFADWLRRVGTGMSNDDYETGVRLLAALDAAPTTTDETGDPR